MTHGRSWVFRLECALSTTSGSLLVLTLVTKEWIEVIFRVDPDHRSGSLEWAIVGVLLVTTLAFTLLARAEHKRPASRSRGVPEIGHTS